MRFQYLGTGASEGIPAAFCACPVCTVAREKGGRNIRRRCSAIIDGKILIDMTPDLWGASTALGADLTHLTSILITHEHIDHFYPSELIHLLPPYSLTVPEKKRALYAGANVLARYETVVSREQRHEIETQLSLHELKAFESVDVDGFTVTPLLARHCPGAFVFLIEKDGKTLLYGNDSGYFPEKTWDFLQNRKINMVSLDCNNPFNSDTPNHMCIEDTVTTRRRLFQLGCVEPSAKFYITHISHVGGLNHEALQERMTLYGVAVAYDGLIVDIK